ncbi:hypothetical protein ABZ619_15615 [Streptomyces sp. NPDC007851]|uniref:hypothetical protein n=1 Tax=Streptomyces sp. NPDC007851 TaxID=3155008 RepID=UPI0033F8A44E
MILVPGWLWRRGPVGRGVGVGLTAGVLCAAFVLVESGSRPAALVVLVLLSPFHGVRAARRMGRIWPAAPTMNGTDRAAVVRATRRGEAVQDPRLTPHVVAYAAGLRRAAEDDRSRRPLVVVITVLAVVLAGYDTVRGATGETAASWLAVGVLLADLLWWPRRRAGLLARADRAAASAPRLPDADRPAGAP